MLIQKLISGGQTGVDRAALDLALMYKVPHGGWCPRGRRAEDGTIPAQYNLQETPGEDPAQRTEWNVRDSDATVVFSVSKTLTGGSRRTVEFAQQYHRPCLHLSAQADGEHAPEKLKTFLRTARVTVLNVAGPRASEEPAAGQFASVVLAAVLGER